MDADFIKDRAQLKIVSMADVDESSPETDIIHGVVRTEYID